MFEILHYRLTPGSQASFHTTMINQSVPLHIEVGINVVFCGPTIGDADGYILVRRFADQEQMDRILQEFYASAAWRCGPRESIVAAIAGSDRILVLAHSA